MNFVFIMTDTQPKSFVGAYGNKRMDTPNLDRLADEGIRFDRAYTVCPLCTPARGSLFTGLYPEVNGAYANNLSTHRHVALAGTIMSHYGYRAAYTGKWHLDGTVYYGNGVPEGGFEPRWWYDGKRWADEIGEKKFKAFIENDSKERLEAVGFTPDDVWGKGVADRAIGFLEDVGDDPFYLAVSFDEPHGPWAMPFEYFDQFDGSELERRPNFFADDPKKAELARVHRGQNLSKRDGKAPAWQDYAAAPNIRTRLGCNAYVDREIGRVIDAVDRLHADDTIVIYTADHGDQLGSHGLWSKGPMMYEESTNIPFIARVPGGPRGAVSQSVTSHLDILPTLLDYAGAEPVPALNGTSMRATLEDPSHSYRDTAMICFRRFAINTEIFGEYYPVRCATDGRYKLTLNLLDTDEFYDLESDPYEMENRVDDTTLAEQRDRLHDWILAEMARVCDPSRSWRWGSRSWRSITEPFYWGGKSVKPPKGFPFQIEGLGM